MSMTMIPLRTTHHHLRLKRLCALFRSSQQTHQETAAAFKEDAPENPSRSLHYQGHRIISTKPFRSRAEFFKESDGRRNASRVTAVRLAPKKIEELVVPVPVSANKNLSVDDIGAEITGKPLGVTEVGACLQNFARRTGIRKLAEEYGITDRLFHQSFTSFRKYCLESRPLDPDFHCILADIIAEKGHVDDIFPYFLKHARMVFPHLDCLEDLKKISDLSKPTSWYQEARSMPTGPRRIVFHAGPTNSGKTHQAMIRFLSAQSGVYCGPLKLLASEIYHRTNGAGVPCDLITGEERRYARQDQTESNHVSCTVEMLNCQRNFEVAIIDEIQMMRDWQRGWAWTRALLGVCAEEVHVCGEAAALELVKGLVDAVAECVTLQTYKRITPLKILDEAVNSLENVQPGDCIVCFSKNDIYSVSREIERNGMEVAVIYGSLPPNTKLAQAKKFNDPADPCKVMVATDAIGMGLNLSIKRVVFYSVTKPQVGEDGDKTREFLSPSQALQIAGRAGRYGTAYDEGEVTTFRSEDLPTLKNLLGSPVEDIEKAGLHPTLEQIEMFAYYLPDATMTNLLDIFLSLCSVDDSRYFMCHFEDFRALAEIIEHVPLPLKIRYTICLAPINRNNQKVATMFLKFARKFSRNEPLTFDWLASQFGWPLPMPGTINDLVDLEGIFDVTDMYLWLGYRFVDMFPDMQLVRDMQVELEVLVQQGVRNIVKLLKNLEKKQEVSVAEASRIKKEKSVGSSAEDRLLRQKEAKVMAADSTEKKVEEYLLHQGTVVSMSKRRGAKGSVTEQLIKKGLLSRTVLDELKKEWLGTVEEQKSGAKKDRRRKK